MKKPCFLWTSYTPDSECLLESVKQVLSLGVDPELCVVAETIGAPLKGSVRALLSASGVKFVPSDYRRKETYEGNLALMTMVRDHGRRSNCSHVFILDSDTLLLNLAEIEAAVDRNDVAMGWTWVGQPMAGCGWLVRTGAADTVIKRCNASEAFTGGGMKVATDLFSWWALDAIYGPEKITRHQFNYEGGFGKAWDYTKAENEGMFRFDMITFGNRYQIKGAKTSWEKRAIVAQTMRKFRLTVLAT